MPEGTQSLLLASKKCTKHAKMPFSLPLASPFTPWKMQPAHGYLDPGAGGLIGIRVMVPHVDEQGRRGLILRAGLSE